MIFGDLGSNYLQWITWDITILASGVIACYLLYKKVAFDALREKLLSFVLLVFMGWTLADYFLLSIVENYTAWDIETIRNVIAFSFLGFGIPVVLNITLRKLSLAKDKYNPKATYLAYRRPTNKISLIVALATAPYSQCSLVCRGKRFYFKGGEIKEKRHFNTGEFSYLKVDSMSLDRARTLIGQKWSPVNNCFRVFKKIIKK